jgi:glycosyltransferase involved in cell wall biosynthesis
MVGISLLTLVPGVVGGSENYARELVRALGRVGRLEYRVFVPTIASNAADGLPSRTVTAYPASSAWLGRATAMTLASVRPGRLRRALELGTLRAVHFPLTVMIPPVDRPPAAVTVLDLQHEVHPGFFSRAELAYRRVFYTSSIRRSRLVVALSAHVATTLVERLGIGEDRIRVVRLGVDRAVFTRGAGKTRLPFLLYPANRWRHKNHDRLFAAFALVRRERPELTLVLTGAGHAGRSLPSGVISRGLVPQSTLIELYQSAAALVFPSLYEGFGQPPLEAMACGCPVAASRAAALPEVCADAALYFDPTSVDDIANAILDVLRRGDELSARGLRRAADFDWDDCARGHDEVYRELEASAGG